MSERDEYDLRKSTDKIGELYPVIMSATGEVVDGFHRINAKANWRREVREDIDTPEKVLLARLISNKFRRQVEASEVRGWINDLAQIAVDDHGIEPGQISGWVAEQTGYHSRSVREYLDEKYKIKTSPEGPKEMEATAVSVISAAEPLIRESEPTVDLDTANGLTKAAKALEREAKRKIKEQKTPEQLEEEKAEKLRKKQIRDQKTRENQAQKEEKLTDKIRKEITREVKQELKQEIKQDPVFKAEVVKEHREEILADIKYTQTTQKTHNYRDKIERIFYQVRGWGVPTVLAIGPDEWTQTLPYIQGIHDWTAFLLQIKPNSPEQQEPTLNLDYDKTRIIEPEYSVKEEN